MHGLAVLGALVFFSPTQDPLVAHVKQTAYARMDLARAVARDASITEFVAAKNGRAETAEEVQKRDARWKTGGEQALRKEVTTGPCAERLRALVKSDSFVLEAIVMDAQGAVVCATGETSDYWQGDEEKWRRPMVVGTEAFVDEPAFDESTASYGIQLSVPILRSARRIGALSLTLKVPRPTAGK